MVPECRGRRPGYRRGMCLHPPDHRVLTHHEAVRRLQRAAGGVAEALAGPDDRLLAHNAGALDLMLLAEAIGDDPVPALQLHGPLAAVLDLDRVGPEILTLRRFRTVRLVLRLDGDGDHVRDGLIHGEALAPGTNENHFRSCVRHICRRGPVTRRSRRRAKASMAQRQSQPTGRAVAPPEETEPCWTAFCAG